MTIEIFDCPQGSPEWHAARMGVPTASEFSSVLAKGEGKTRRTYMLKLAGEILTGEPMHNHNNEHMDRGKEMETEARDLYAFVNSADVRRVGFVRNGNKGCSPDGLIDANGGVEIKTMLPHLLIACHLKGELPSEHKPQVQGGIWTCERDWWDFVAYWPKLPLFVTRVYRDDGYIRVLADEVNRFNDELAGVVEKLRSMGQAA